MQKQALSRRQGNDPHAILAECLPTSTVAIGPTEVISRRLWLYFQTFDYEFIGSDSPCIVFQRVTVFGHYGFQFLAIEFA
jgi:hypothetical protein